MASNYNRKDQLYQRAKDEGFRSRAAYKLLEIDQKFKLLKQGSKIIDLGSWPGGWLQVASAALGPRGLVVGIDLQELEPLNEANIQCIVGDVRDDLVIAQALQISGQKYDLVMSDISAKLTGIREADTAASVNCAEMALEVATKVLRPGGNMVIKVFKNSEIDRFVKSNQKLFNKIARLELKATRNTSNEYYLVWLGFK